MIKKIAMKKMLAGYLAPCIVLFLGLFACNCVFAATIYVSPNGTGNGESESSPLGLLETAVNALSAGDVLILLDGQYKQPLVINTSGTAAAPITIKAKNVGKAFINGEGVRQPVHIYNQSYIRLDGLKAGNSVDYVYQISDCHHITITRCSGFNAGGAETDDANYHIFTIAYSTYVHSEDVWAWGTGRYSFIYYGCSYCSIRRAVLRPGLYRRVPHAGLAVYCSDHTISENVIVFGARTDHASLWGGTGPWTKMTSGFVCEGHDCINNKSSRDNKHFGCIAIDNGEEISEWPDSNPAGCFIWNEYQGSFEDMVVWKNAETGFGFYNNQYVNIMPTRSLEGKPQDIQKNTGPKILKRYVNGQLTDDDLWPWPYEELIKADLGMSETITEYVRRQVAPYIEIPLVTPPAVPTRLRINTH